jgi:hypothetical protein
MKRLGLLSSLVFITTLTISVLLSSPVLSNEKRGIQIRTGRYALVIGNGAYSVSPLKNPVNDSEDMAQLLEQLSFVVIHRHDIGLREMETSVREFGHMLETGGTGLFYYAGHGMQVEGRNYLIPVDAVIESESDVRFEALDVGRVLGKMEDAGNGLNIVILDACRDNPFARGFRSTRSGLARMDAPRGTLIAYATAPGSVAADGDGRNGIYTGNLLSYMAIPGMPVEQVFKNVRIGVIRDTNQKQVPWETSSLTGDFYFAPPAVVKETARKEKDFGKTQQHGSRESTEVIFWESIKDSDKPELFKAYLRKFPNGVFSDIARYKSKELSPSSSQKEASKVQEPGIENPEKPLLAYAKDEGQVTQFKLRSESMHLPNQSDIDEMLTRYDFYDTGRNPGGSFLNQFSIQSEDVILDVKTGLMWQRSGSPNEKSFIGAKSYIEQLNEDKFAGFSDWRLPTIEELASIIAKTKANDLYIDKAFTKQHKRCWSSDMAEKTQNGLNMRHEAWIANFVSGRIEKAIWYISGVGYSSWYVKDTRNYVRAVRSNQ